MTALLTKLAAIGVPRDDLAELEQALKADQAENNDETGGQPGPRVQRWLGRISLQGAKPSGTILTSVITTPATDAVKAFFGL